MVAVLIIIVSTSIRYFGKALQKKCLSKMGGIVFFTFSIPTICHNFLKVIKNPLLMTGYLITMLSTFFWLILLATYDLKIVIPLGGLSYAIALLFGKIFFDERITLHKLVGLVMIFSGTFLIFQ
jgi:uncharacterized membrane protein